MEKADDADTEVRPLSSRSSSLKTPELKSPPPSPPQDSDLSRLKDISAVVDGLDGIKLSQGASLGLSDFELIRVIGRGSYAKVLLVRLKKNEQAYAMKVVKKELVHDDEVRWAGAPSSPLLFCRAVSVFLCWK